jgi:hypothetical protein
MTRTLKLFLLLAFAFLAGQSELLATASTHIWAPSTDVQPFLKWHLTSDFYAAARNDSLGNRPAPVTNLGLTVGILPYDKYQMEIGFDQKAGLGSLDNEPLYLNAKFGIPENSFGDMFPALAAGVFDVGTSAGKTDFNVLYGKLAKTFTAGDLSLGRFSLGYYRGNSSLLTGPEGSDNKGLLLAWERTISEVSDRLWVCVEYMGGKSAYGSLNLGFSWKFADNVAVLFGYDIYNNRDLADTLTVQTDIDF